MLQALNWRVIAVTCSLFSFYWILLRPRHRQAHIHPRPPLPVPSEPPAFQRVIVAVGDLHGDHPNMIEVLQMAGVISKNETWSGAVDYFVQTGDIVDRGDDTIKMYRYLEDLRVEARGDGGDVVSHLGNHEIMNLLGDWRYVYPTEIATFGGIAARQRLLTTGWIGKAWRANYTIASRLPLHPSLGSINQDYDESKAGSLQGLSRSALSFMHGGLSPTFGNIVPYPSAINEIGSRLVRRLQDRTVQPPPFPPNPYPGMPPETTAAEEELYGENGPVWYRGWALDPDAVVCKAVDVVLAKAGVRRMVMGHTPHFTEIVSRCDGKIVLIDTGISHAYGGVLSAAKFTYSLWPSKVKGRWIERDLVTAVYPDRHNILADNIQEIQADFL